MLNILIDIYKKYYLNFAKEFTSWTQYNSSELQKKL